MGLIREIVMGFVTSKMGGSSRRVRPGIHKRDRDPSSLYGICLSEIGAGPLACAKIMEGETNSSIPLFASDPLTVAFRKALPCATSSSL